MAESATFKVCFIAPNIYGLYNPQSRTPYGGGDAQLYELARFFAKNPKYQVSVITGDFGQDEMEFYSGTLVYRSNFDTSSTFWQRTLRQWNPLEKMLLEIDAQVYIMAGASGLAQSVAEFCNKANRVFLFRVTHQRDCDGTFVHGNVEEGKRYQWALHQAQGIVCQTQEQRAMLARTEGLQSYVFPNAIPLPSVREEGRTEVIWVGEAHEWKQPEMFMRLALTLPNQSFTIIAMPRNLEYFEKVVSKTRDIPNVGFQNSVPYNEMPRFIEKSRLLVNTSRFEGIPYSFTQAAAYGVPVASLNIDPDGLLEKHQIGRCAQGSELRLVQDVHDLIAYPRQWKRFHEQALKYAESNCAIQKVGRLYEKLFLKCVGELRKPAKKK